MVGKMYSQQDTIANKRQVLLDLVNEKQLLEAEIRREFSILEQNGVGMDEALVDAQGFPRNDIDVYRVRHSRHKIICLRNDLKNLMIRIETGLHVVHAESGAGASSQAMDTEEGREGSVGAESSLEPIARVKSVISLSPAFESGLLSDDLILEFGSVNSKNFKSLEDISKVVSYSMNGAVPVSVLRGFSTAIIKLSLTPKRWSGNGLLGCTILPLEHVER